MMKVDVDDAQRRVLRQFIYNVFDAFVGAGSKKVLFFDVGEDQMIFHSLELLYHVYVRKLRILEIACFPYGAQRVVGDLITATGKIEIPFLGRSRNEVVTVNT